MRVGIIGCGKIFPMHAYSIKEIPSVEIVAISDVNQEKLDFWQEKLSVKGYSDYKKMIEEERLDSVHICTPHYLHKDMAIFALKHGVHVFIEKPSSITYEETLAMNVAKRESGKSLVVCFQNRFNQSTLYVKEQYKNGNLGEFLGAKAVLAWSRSDEYYSKSGWKGTWEYEGGGLIIDQAIHTLDAVPWILGENVEVSRVFLDNWGHKLIEVDDIADISLTFPKGQKFHFSGNNFYLDDEPIKIQMIFDKARVDFTGDSVKIQYRNSTSVEIHPEESPLFSLAGHKQYWGTSHLKAIKDFYCEIQKGNTSPKNTIEECLDIQKIVDTIYNKSEFSNGKR